MPKGDSTLTDLMRSSDGRYVVGLSFPDEALVIGFVRSDCSATRESVEN